MKKYYAQYPIIFLLVLLSVNYTTAQDPHFSQFYANRVYLNAAYAGFDPGTTLTLNHRNQWFGIPDGSLGRQAGFRTYNATLGIRIPCLLEMEGINIGVAVSAFKDETGDAPLTTQGLGAAWSLELITDQNNRMQNSLRFGTQFSFMQKSLENNYLIFSNQLDPVTGLINNPTGENLQSQLYGNLNVGVLFRHTHDGVSKRTRKKTKGKNRRPKRLNDEKFQFTLGVNLSNVTKPNISLLELSNEYKLPMRITVHGGFTSQLTSMKGVRAPIHLAPQFRIDRQVNLNLYTVGTYIFSKAYYLGGFYQFNTGRPETPSEIQTLQGNIIKNTHALVINAGIDIRTLLDNGVNFRKRRSGIVLGFSYDFNVGGLSGGSTFGTAEINLRYNFSRGGKKQRCGAVHKSELYNGQCPVRF